MSLERAEEVLTRARSTTVLVVGDLMLDRYVTGSVDRVSPEAPVPVVRVEEETMAVGGAGNVALNVVALGANCRVVGAVGSDPDGNALRSALVDAGVPGEGIVDLDDRPTTVKTRVRARAQQIVRFDRESDSDLPPEQAARILRAIENASEGCDVIIMEDYDKGVLVPSVIRGVFELAERIGAMTVVDPKRRHFFHYDGATVFKPNAKELSESLNDENRPDDSEWMETTRRRLKCRDLLLTLGGHGMAFRSEDGTYLRAPAVARSVYDVSGAGDTVVAWIGVCLAAGATAPEAVVFANHAAALGVAKSGVVSIPVEEWLRGYRRYSSELEISAS